MRTFILNLIKGFAIGIANLIPGVSGGTIAFITGVFERLIFAIKNLFSKPAFLLLIKFKISQWVSKTDLLFLLQITLGVLISLFSLARAFAYLFDNYSVLIWSFFFGLVLASIFSISRTIERWNFTTVFIYIIGISIAITLALLSPASENQNTWYLFICGIVAAASTILPGLSGSFVLVLMGNYELIMIRSINELNFTILLPVVIGGIIGIISLSYLLTWLFNRFKNYIISFLSGFILGSLLIIWPWKTIHYKIDPISEQPLISNSGKLIIEKYSWHLPPINHNFIYAIFFILLGISLVLFIDYLAKRVYQTKNIKNE